MFLDVAQLLQERSRDERVTKLLKSDTQLPTLEECRQEGAPLSEGFLSFISTLASMFTADSYLVEVDPVKEISFNCFSWNRVAHVKFEDFRLNTDGVSKWHTISLTSRLNERKLFFSIIKKFLLQGLNINEVLTLEYLIELRWSKMSGEEQAFCTSISTMALLSVNRARNFTSTGLSLLKLSRRLLKDPTKLLEVRVSKVTLLFINLFVDLDKYEKSIKLTYVSRVTPPKKFPEKKHIGVSNSQDGSKQSSGETLDSEILPDSLLPQKESNPASEISEAWLVIKQILINL